MYSLLSPLIAVCSVYCLPGLHLHPPWCSRLIRMAYSPGLLCWVGFQLAAPTVWIFPSSRHQLPLVRPLLLTVNTCFGQVSKQLVFFLIYSAECIWFRQTANNWYFFQIYFAEPQHTERVLQLNVWRTMCKHLNRILCGRVSWRL